MCVYLTINRLCQINAFDKRWTRSVCHLNESIIHRVFIHCVFVEWLVPKMILANVSYEHNQHNIQQLDTQTFLTSIYMQHSLHWPKTIQFEKSMASLACRTKVPNNIHWTLIQAFPFYLKRISQHDNGISTYTYTHTKWIFLFQWLVSIRIIYKKHWTIQSSVLFQLFDSFSFNWNVYWHYGNKFISNIRSKSYYSGWFGYFDAGIRPIIDLHSSIWKMLYKIGKPIQCSYQIE